MPIQCRATPLAWPGALCLHSKVIQARRASEWIPAIYRLTRLRFALVRRHLMYQKSYHFFGSEFRAPGHPGSLHCVSRTDQSRYHSTLESMWVSSTVLEEGKFRQMQISPERHSLIQHLTFASIAPALITLIITLFLSPFVFASERPHIILILADDLGWGDVGFHGSENSTPQIDELAQRGVQLDQFYVQPVCSPSRSALMTGRYPMRMGLQCGVHSAVGQSWIAASGTNAGRWLEGSRLSNGGRWQVASWTFPTRVLSHATRIRSSVWSLQR